MEKRIHFGVSENVTIFYDMDMKISDIEDYIAQYHPIKVSDGNPVTAEEILKIVEDDINGIESDVQVTEFEFKDPHSMLESIMGYLRDNIYDYESDRETNDDSYDEEISIIGD